MDVSRIPALHTLEFVSAHLAAPGRRILEIGCGLGALARLLQDAGHDVVALDSSEEAVASARRHGVAAQVARWPDFVDAPFDVVVFSRSLHHMFDLDAAVRHARELLNKDGKVLVEDFAFTDATSADVAWFHALLMKLHAAGSLCRLDGTLIESVLRHDGQLAGWHEGHDHTLHRARVMQTALEKYFADVTVNHVPYLYRYVADVTSEAPDPDSIICQVLEQERQAGAARRINLIGRNFLALGAS